MLPEMRILAGGEHFIFQQDGARPHRAKDTVAYLNVLEFIEPEYRPPNSTDLNFVITAFTPEG